MDETIAVLKIGGPITDKVAQKTEKALQKLFKQIKDKKIKALVLRVDSPGGAITACETIHQQLQALPIKTVVSFGNVSASGGYYISTHADRIFASPTTITGSIGVFMIRMNLSGLAKQFGITFDSVHTSDLSGSMDPFTPINPRMKENFSNSAERSYKQFKSLVGAGRKMTDDAVETVAQGRVWTGHQAKEIGLVDELGGLHRAIAYCQRSFTNSGHAQIISWPPQKTLWELLQTKDWDEEDLPSPSILLLAATDYFGISSPTTATNHQSTSSSSWALLDPSKLSAASSGMMLTIDENWAIRCLLQNKQEAFPDDVLASFPPSFWD